MDTGALQFSGYSAAKYRKDVKGKKRMAGDVFQKTFGDEDWNKEFLETHKDFSQPKGAITVDVQAGKDLVAGQAREKEAEKKREELIAKARAGG